MSKKEYKITITEQEDGSITLDRKNKGFNAHELLGYLERIKYDINKQIDEALGLINSSQKSK